MGRQINYANSCVVYGQTLHLKDKRLVHSVIARRDITYVVFVYRGQYLVLRFCNIQYYASDQIAQITAGKLRRLHRLQITVVKLRRLHRLQITAVKLRRLQRLQITVTLLITDYKGTSYSDYRQIT